MRFKDLTGQKFGRLTVLYRANDRYYSNGTIASRVSRGWNPVDALTIPVRSIAEHI